jgi:tRNA G10  N-methylase Trm11/very-short-patch-repair endonuclease
MVSPKYFIGYTNPHGITITSFSTLTNDKGRTRKYWHGTCPYCQKDFKYEQWDAARSCDCQGYKLECIEKTRKYRIGYINPHGIEILDLQKATGNNKTVHYVCPVCQEPKQVALSEFPTLSSCPCQQLEKTKAAYDKNGGHPFSKKENRVKGVIAKTKAHYARLKALLVPGYTNKHGVEILQRFSSSSFFIRCPKCLDERTIQTKNLRKVMGCGCGRYMRYGNTNKPWAIGDKNRFDLEITNITPKVVSGKVRKNIHYVCPSCNKEAYVDQCHFHKKVGCGCIKAQRTRIVVNSRYNQDTIMHVPHFRKKCLGNNKRTKPEKYIAEFLKNNHFQFEEQMVLNNKAWDFGIFKDGKLHLIVEIDGEFYHSKHIDPFYDHQDDYTLDDKRVTLIPEGVHYLVVDSLKTKEAPAEILKHFDIDFNTYIDENFNRLFKSPFPFPIYRESRMNKDWSHLSISFTNVFTPNNMTCNSVMTHFHHSIFKASRKGYKSPFEAWNDPTLLRKCIENRTVYSGNLDSTPIVRGFSASKIAPRVSVFQPYWARFLLANFASPDSKVIGDPYSGFSGRMLGTTSLGLKYIGTDINPTIIQEANQIVDFLNLHSLVDLKCTNEFDQEVDCVLTCPPYDDIEKWAQEEQKPLEWHLSRILAIKAKEYLIVIPERDAIRLGYQNKVVHTFINKSHFGSNKEVCIKL